MKLSPSCTVYTVYTITHKSLKSATVEFILPHLYCWKQTRHFSLSQQLLTAFVAIWYGGPSLPATFFYGLGALGEGFVKADLHAALSS